MNKEELIKHLRIKGVERSSLNDDFNDGRAVGTSCATDLINQLDEPAHELMEVPTAIYDDIIWHEKLGHDKTYTIWSIMDGLEDDTYDFGIKEWIRSHDDELIKAVVYGCKPIEPLYIMPVPYAENMYYYKYVDEKITDCFDSDRYMMFTAAEIDEYFPKIKEFAEEVEE